jgi:hypothetical protein
MKIIVETQSKEIHKGSEQSIEIFVRKRQKKKRITGHATIKARSELDQGEIGEP